MRCSNPDQVTFVSQHVHQFQLTRQTPPRRIALALFTADLDRNAQVGAVVQSETEQGVCNLWRVVKRNYDIINRLNLVDVDRSIVVVDHVIVVGQIAIAANVL